MGTLNPQDFDRALKLSILEGGAWACMVGLAETYFLATAVHLGASPLQLGLTLALPLALGALGPLTALAILARSETRRRFTAATAWLQVATLLAMSSLLVVDHLTVEFLIGGICLYQITGQAAATAWSSWYGDVVPAAMRGRWFARRNRIVYLSTCAGLVMGGWLLHQIEPLGVAGERSRIGLALLFAMAAASRIVSSALLGRSPEPTFRGLAKPARLVTLMSTDRGNQAIRILVLGALFHFTIYWSAPYFAPFMLEELHFSYLQYMAAALCAIVFKAVFTSAWGHFVDQRGARVVYLAAMLCVALVPLPWMLAGGIAGVLMAQAVSGTAWSGYEVSYFSLLLEKSTRQTRPFVFAAQSIANGTFQLGGVLIAASFLIPRVDSYRDIFAFTLAGRLLVTLAAPLLLMGVRSGPRMAWSRLNLRLFGLRPNGGFSMRPILDTADESGVDGHHPDFDDRPDSLPK